MKMTPLAKAFVALVILGVVGYTGYHYYGDQLKEWSKGGGHGTGGHLRRRERRALAGGTCQRARHRARVTKDDFAQPGRIRPIPIARIR